MRVAMDMPSLNKTKYHCPNKLSVLSKQKLLIFFHVSCQNLPGENHFILKTHKIFVLSIYLWLPHKETYGQVLSVCCGGHRLERELTPELPNTGQPHLMPKRAWAILVF